MTTILLAGSIAEYEFYCKENGIKRDEMGRTIVYARTDNLRGRTIVSVVVYGTFWNRSDAFEVYDKVMAYARTHPGERRHPHNEGST